LRGRGSIGPKPRPSSPGQLREGFCGRESLTKERLSTPRLVTSGIGSSMGGDPVLLQKKEEGRDFGWLGGKKAGGGRGKNEIIGCRPQSFSGGAGEEFGASARQTLRYERPQRKAGLPVFFTCGACPGLFPGTTQELRAGPSPQKQWGRTELIETVFLGRLRPMIG